MEIEMVEMGSEKAPSTSTSACNSFSGVRNIS
jgi:hypothetical protein